MRGLNVKHFPQITVALPYGTSSTTIRCEPRVSNVGISWSLTKRMESGHSDSYMTCTITCRQQHRRET